MSGDVIACKYCKSKGYQIHYLYGGLKQRVLVVECGDCREEVIPVVVDYLMPNEKVNEKCLMAWNGANAVPNNKGEPGATKDD